MSSPVAEVFFLFEKTGVVASHVMLQNGCCANIPGGKVTEQNPDAIFPTLPPACEAALMADAEEHVIRAAYS